eukprot:6491092-Amphidinium_carterae.7
MKGKTQEHFGTASIVEDTPWVAVVQSALPHVPDQQKQHVEESHVVHTMRAKNFFMFSCACFLLSPLREGPCTRQRPTSEVLVAAASVLTFHAVPHPCWPHIPLNLPRGLKAIMTKREMTQPDTLNSQSAKYL